MRLIINRIEPTNKVQTLGNFFIVDGEDPYPNVSCTDYKYDPVDGDLIYMQGVTLELPWKDNQKNISCIPKGVYSCKKYYSFKFHTTCIKVADVPNRTKIRIHPLNYFYNSLGCIGVGKNFTDINNDGYTDITDSRKTLKKMIKLLPKRFYLEIT